MSPRLLLLLLLLAQLPMGMSADARARSEARRQDGEKLVAGLVSARRCQILDLAVGESSRPRAPCRRGAPPERFVTLHEDLVALAFEAPTTQLGIVGERRMYPAFLCQLAIESAVIHQVSRTLRNQRFRRRASDALAPARARRFDRACDVEIRQSSTSSLTLPWVGPQCARAVGKPGGLVDAPALRACLDTLVSSWLARALPGLEQTRPNIIVVLSDDQRFDAIDATHSPDPDVPLPAMPAVMERLANQGVTFSNAFVSTPVCNPSRASFLTGRYAHQHGVYRNRGPLGAAHFDDRESLATVLHGAGYRTGFFGKYSTEYRITQGPRGEYPYTPPGWDEFYAFDNLGGVTHDRFSMFQNGERVHYGVDQPAYSTDVLADQAADFVAKASQTDQPFLLFVSTAAPHSPYRPADRHLGAFSRSPLFLPPSFFEKDVSDKPAWVQSLPPVDLLNFLGSILGMRAQLEMGLSIDELVAALFTKLEAAGVADETVFVLTSDNGLAWGEHRWLSKACPWEECLRVPLLIRYPKLAPLGRVEAGMAVNVDLAPTLVDLAGATVPEHWTGRSLVTSIDGTQREARSDFLVESYSGDLRTFVGVRNLDWLWVEYLSGEQELYDLSADPFQLENLARDPSHQTRIEALRARRAELWPGWEALPL